MKQDVLMCYMLFKSSTVDQLDAGDNTLQIYIKGRMQHVMSVTQ